MEDGRIEPLITMDALEEEQCSDILSLEHEIAPSTHSLLLMHQVQYI